MIQNIDVSKIRPHYNNPRKELGDLAELAESIKKTGILQNLTVVPWFSSITGVGCDDSAQQEKAGYIAVIGHRRLAAAKLAGLKEVPCVISDMSFNEQIATMLLENMQRNDLTLYEQAEGFQMMLDLGESVSDISEKTGLSTTTVRLRVKLLDLDKEKFRKSVERGATLSDYIELEKIEDADLKNSVLEAIGTANFKWKLQGAIDKEQANKKRAIIIAEVEKFATRIADSNAKNFDYVRSYYTSDVNKDGKFVKSKLEDADTVEYFFTVGTSDYVGVTLYKKADGLQDDAETNQERAYREREERRKALGTISKQAYQLRSAFIKEISNSAAKKNLPVIIEYNLSPLVEGYYTRYPDRDDYIGFIGGAPGISDKTAEKQLISDFIKSNITDELELTFLISVYLMLDNAQESYYDWNGRHHGNAGLDRAYEFLEKLGYEISEEELAMKNGTHELFAPAEDGDSDD